MADLSRIVEKLNIFLSGKGLEPVSGVPQDMEGLLSAVLKSIWQLPDPQQRESIAFTVMSELKKLFGGKNIEEVYQRTIGELEAAAVKQKEAAAKKAEELRKKDPNYVPPFDELFGK